MSRRPEENQTEQISRQNGTAGAPPEQVFLKGMMAALNFAQRVTNENNTCSSTDSPGQPPKSARTESFEKLILASLVVIMQEIRRMNDELAMQASPPTSLPSSEQGYDYEKGRSRSRSRSRRRHG